MAYRWVCVGLDNIGIIHWKAAALDHDVCCNWIMLMWTGGCEGFGVSLPDGDSDATTLEEVGTLPLPAAMRIIMSIFFVKDLSGH